MKLAVIGGGIAGLAAAWELAGAGEVTVFEPGRLGGKLLTSSFLGRAVDEGADSFLTRVPDAIELCRDLDLDHELIAPRPGAILLWVGGRLRALPEGLVLGVPRRIRPLATSGLLSPAGVARAALDLVLPRRPLGGDASVEDIIRSRFGAEVASRLVEPLLGSIHAAPIAKLGAAATAPQVLAAARSHRSLLLGLRHQQARDQGGPLFLAPQGGMGALVDALVERLKSRGATFRRFAVTDLRPAGGGGVVVDDERFDAAVAAVPAPVAARLLGPHAPLGLGTLTLTSVAIVTLAFDTNDLSPPAATNGILVPPAEGSLMTACSFGSAKWPHWAARGQSVVRLSAGRHGDPRAATIGDAALAAQLVDELGRALGRTLAPQAVRVSRWPDSFPLSGVGHLERVRATEGALARDLPSLAVAGASYAGSGVPACVGSGRRAARRVLEAAAALR